MTDTNQLPEPEPEGVIVVGTQALRGFTADQMRACALHARAILALRPERVPMTDEQIRSMCKQGWVFETVKQWVRIFEAHHGITAQAKEAEAQQPATTEPVVDVRCEGCGYMTHHREHMGCVRAAKQHTHPAPSVPEGYALVPIEPTQAMLKVQTWDFNRFYSPREIWAAMLAAKDAK